MDIKILENKATWELKAMIKALQLPISSFLNDDEDIWWNPQHPTYHAHEGRPSCQNCGKPADMNNKYSSGQIKWRDMCYDCHDHRTDKNYLATKFIGETLY